MAARVCTLDQDLTVQRQALRAAGCGVIRVEEASGSRRDGRTELQVLQDFVQAGDSPVVTRIDRLARSMKDLQDIVHELKGRGVTLRATEQPVDTGIAAGKAFLEVGAKPVDESVVEAVLSQQIDDLEPRLTRNGYDVRSLVEQRARNSPPRRLNVNLRLMVRALAKRVLAELGHRAVIRYWRDPWTVIT